MVVIAGTGVGIEGEMNTVLEVEEDDMALLPPRTILSTLVTLEGQEDQEVSMGHTPPLPDQSTTPITLAPPLPTIKDTTPPLHHTTLDRYPLTIHV